MHNSNQHFLSSEAAQNDTIEDDNLNKKKVSNPSLVKKRCIDNFEKVCSLCVVYIYTKTQYLEI